MSACAATQARRGRLVKDSSQVEARHDRASKKFGLAYRSTMRSPRMTLAITCACVIMLSLGILWVSKNNAVDPSLALPQTQMQVENTAEDVQESIWGQFIPKSQAQQRIDHRLALQSELAKLIVGQSGIEQAHVVLSLPESQGLGRRFEPPTACVTITPSSTVPLTAEAIESVTRLVASGVSGLSAEDVTVVDNSRGMIRTGSIQPTLNLKQHSESTRIAVEEALGLIAATVHVTMVSPPQGATFIPWIDNKKPNVQLTLPRSWITRRASQVGGVQVVLNNITRIAQAAAPGADVQIAIINDPALAGTDEQTAQSSAKQWALIIGLTTLLLTGTIGHRRKQTRTPTTKPAMHVAQEAAFILSLPYGQARVAIDALSGPKQRAVLETITSTAETPIVEIPARKVPDLVRCG